MKHYSRFEVALLNICLCFCLIACTPFGGFKPPPKWWTYFEGNGASEEEIRIALLECGSDVPGNSFEFSQLPEEFLRDDGRDDPTSVAQCMVNSGFRFNGRTPLCARPIDTRTGLPVPPFPACMPGWVPTPRRVENRLNSAYCKMYPKTRWCQPVVVSSAQWAEMHKEEWEARRRRRQPILDELHKQGYRTDSIGTGDIDYCIRQAKENTPAQGKLMPYFEKCMKVKRKMWDPEFCYVYRAPAYAVCVEISEDEAKIPEVSTQEKKD